MAVKTPLDFIIEIDEEPVGLAVMEGEVLRFHATHPAVQQLHDRLYEDATAIRRAVLKAFRSAA